MSLKIVFTGLCVFVRLSPQKVRVLMPNFNQAADIHHVAVPAHVAFMSWMRGEEGVYEVPSPSDPLRLPHFAVFSQTVPGATDVFLLNAESIALETKPPFIPQPVVFDPHGMVEIDKVVANGKIAGPLVADAFDPRPERVSAYFDVTMGTLEPITVTRMLEFQPRMDEHAPYSGPFAEQVRWILPDGEYLLKSRTFGPRAGRVQFRIDAKANDVLITAGNLPLEDLVDPDSERARSRDEELIDHHFHRYYELCATMPEVHPLPHRVSARTGALRPLGGNCPPAVFTK
jgi:hypothetical protein